MIALSVVYVSLLACAETTRTVSDLVILLLITIISIKQWKFCIQTNKIKTQNLNTYSENAQKHKTKILMTKFTLGIVYFLYRRSMHWNY